MTDAEKEVLFERVRVFKTAVEELEDKHGIELAHQDGNGSFLYYTDGVYVYPDCESFF